jgi:hypothetical protein
LNDQIGHPIKKFIKQVYSSTTSVSYEIKRSFTSSVTWVSVISYHRDVDFSKHYAYS